MKIKRDPEDCYLDVDRYEDSESIISCIRRRGRVFLADKNEFPLPNCSVLRIPKLDPVYSVPRWPNKPYQLSCRHCQLSDSITPILGHILRYLQCVKLMKVKEIIIISPAPIDRVSMSCQGPICRVSLQSQKHSASNQHDNPIPFLLWLPGEIIAFQNFQRHMSILAWSIREVFNTSAKPL